MPNSLRSRAPAEVDMTPIPGPGAPRAEIRPGIERRYADNRVDEIGIRSRCSAVLSNNAGSDIAGRAVTENERSRPEGGFVFCCANQKRETTDRSGPPGSPTPARGQQPQPAKDGQHDRTRLRRPETE
jgi:hypothetical protein